MFEKLNEQIEACQRRADEAALKAAIAPPLQRAEFEAAQDLWVALANSYGATANGPAFDQSQKTSGSLKDHKREVDTLVLQEISASLIREGDIHALFERIVDAAVCLMRSDFGSMQAFHAETNELRLLAWRGFHPASAAFWDRIGLASVSTSCGAAFSSGRRSIVTDVESCEFIAGSADLDHFRLSGIKAIQSTPLLSRTGELLGMISTHWRELHQPTEDDLRLLDVLARQGADLIERIRSEEQILLLAREAEHRAKNILAIVQATVQLSQSDTADDLKKVILGRIHALANVHRLFADGRWQGADLRTIASEELTPYGSEIGGRVQIDGPTVTLKPDVAQMFAIVLHELATNAAKYGALTEGSGTVRVAWSTDKIGALDFSWIETGGPPTFTPALTGFGTRVMKNIVSSLNGQLQVDWHRTGLACEIRVPI